MKYALLGAIAVIVVVALVFAPSIWERIHRDNSPITTIKPKPAQPTKVVAAPKHSHRAGAR